MPSKRDHVRETETLPLKGVRGHFRRLYDWAAGGAEAQVGRYLILFLGVAGITIVSTIVLFRAGMNEMESAFETNLQSGEHDEQVDALMQLATNTQVAGHLLRALRSRDQLAIWEADYRKTRAALAGFDSEALAPEAERLIREAGLGLDRYEERLRHYVETELALGWREDEGLHGMFRRHAHALEAIISTMVPSRRDAALVQLLMMRRHEKDFIQRRDAGYVDRFAIAGDRLVALLDTAKLEREKAAAGAEELSAYRATFLSYVKRSAELQETFEAAEEQVDVVVRTLAEIKAIMQRQVAATSQTFAEGQSTISRNTLVAILIAFGAAAAVCGYIIRGLGKALHEMKLAERTKSEFLAVMGHELRTPLNAIIGFSDVIRNEMLGPLGQPQYKEYVTDIHRSGQTLLELINDVLDFAKMDRMIAEPHPQPVCVADSVNRLLRFLAPRIGKKRISVRTDIQDNLFVNADPAMLKKALHNVIDNAIKFTTAGEVTISAEQIGEEVAIEVADTGMGIPRLFVKKVLLPFFQVDHGHTRHFDGSGLGLAMVKAIVALHRGRIDIESEPGKGTRARMTFPCVNRQTRMDKAA